MWDIAKKIRLTYTNEEINEMINNVNNIRADQIFNEDEVGMDPRGVWTKVYRDKKKEIFSLEVIQKKPHFRLLCTLLLVQMVLVQLNHLKFVRHRLNWVEANSCCITYLKIMDTGKTRLVTLMLNPVLNSVNLF